MLYNVDEIAEGQTVWLYPHTRTAGPNVHRMLQVKVLKDPKLHWPWVIVTWDELGGGDKWEKVHKDDIRRRNPGKATKDETKQGDGVGSGSTSSRLGTNRRLVLPGARKYEPTEGQETLF
jgi:hypothetical protein